VVQAERDERALDHAVDVNASAGAVHRPVENLIDPAADGRPHEAEQAPTRMTRERRDDRHGTFAGEEAR
jgi:hypothetical protein